MTNALNLNFQNNTELLRLVNLTTPIPILCLLDCKPMDPSTFAQLSNRVSGVTAPTTFPLEIITKDVRRLVYQFDTQEARANFSKRLTKNAFFGHEGLPTKVFAPKYHAQSNGDKEPVESSWKYSMVDEYERMKDRPAAPNFKLLDQGPTYAKFPTYPQHVLIPASITEETMDAVAAYRSSKRVPAVVFVHPTTGTSLSRCSQPRSGFSKTCEADQDLVKSIWTANPQYVDTGAETANTDNGALTMLILDARSRAAATANLVVGGGYEGTGGYGKCSLEFAGIANIHAVRESFLALHALCSENKITETMEVLSTQWYSHIHTILAAAQLMTAAMDGGSSVLTHCSDGWDRTSQLSSLVQLLIDPEFRTAKGFCKLIQKEWLSFGHKFCERMCFGATVSASTAGASPVFLQFMDAVSQIIKNYPNAFEFNEYFLIQILDYAHSGQCGDFLANCEAAYRANYASTTTSCWQLLENTWNRPDTKKHYVNPGFDAQAGRIRLNMVIANLSVWEAYFHRYNAQYFESLKQRKTKHFFDNESSLATSLMNPGDAEHHLEQSIWKGLLQRASNADMVSSQVREQIVQLYELLDQGAPECHVRLHFRGDELQQMVVQQNPAYRVQKMVPSLKEALMETYEPNASSVHKSDSLVVLRATSATSPNGTRVIQSTLVMSNYKFLYDMLAGWSLKVWRSAASIVTDISSYFPAGKPFIPGRSIASPSSGSPSPSPSPQSAASSVTSSEDSILSSSAEVSSLASDSSIPNPSEVDHAETRLDNAAYELSTSSLTTSPVATASP